MSKPVSSDSSLPASFSDSAHLERVAPSHKRTVSKVKQQLPKLKLPAATPDLGALMGRMGVFEEFSLDSDVVEQPKPEPRKRSKTEPEEELAPGSIMDFLKGQK